MTDLAFIPIAVIYLGADTCVDLMWDSLRQIRQIYACERSRRPRYWIIVLLAFHTKLIIAATTNITTANANYSPLVANLYSC